MNEPIVAGVELGGTKAIALIGRGREIIARAQWPTEAPDVTLPLIRAQLDAWVAEFHPEALGIGSFGPLSLDPASPDHGRILKTPKPGWSGADLLGAFSGVVDGPVALHTDVTGAMLAEGRWGAGVGLDDFIYITVGTGIGMGILSGGRPVTGMLHPEAGHLRVRRQAGDAFPGLCPFHADCLEGLAAGPAIGARFMGEAFDAGHDDPRWGPVVDALAEGVALLQLTLAPRAILFGGGIPTAHPHLVDRVGAQVIEKLAGYLPGFDAASVSDRIRLAGLGADAGPLGVLALAATALTPPV